MFSQKFHQRREDPQSKLISEIKVFGNQIFTDTESQQLSLILSESQFASNLQDSASFVQNNEIKYEKFTQSLKKQVKINKYLPKQYVSPYSQRGLSTSRFVPVTQKLNINEIFGQQTQRINIQKSKNKSKNKTDKQYQWIGARYLNTKTVMDSFQGYSAKKMKTEALENHQIKKKKNTESAEKSLEKWNDFFKRNKNWTDRKENNVINLKKLTIQKQADKLKQKPPVTQRPKLTIDECIKKIKRDTLRLRQKLAQNQVNYYKYERKDRLKSKSINKIQRVCNSLREVPKNIQSKIQLQNEKESSIDHKLVNDISFSSNSVQQNISQNPPNKFISLKSPQELSFLIQQNKKIKMNAKVKK